MALSGPLLLATNPPVSQSDVLLHSNNLTYAGAFKVPNIGADGASAGYGFSTAQFAVRSGANSMFMVGNSKSNEGVSEISIPALVNDPNIAHLNRATQLQNFVDVVDNLPVPLTGVGALLWGDLLVVGSTLVGTFYANYTGTPTSISHCQLSNLTLLSGTINGLYQVGTGLGGGDARHVGGYMCAIPPDWQSSLGAPYATGLADISIISTTSNGPGLFGFDPSAFNYSGAVPTQNYVFYDNANHPLAPYDGDVTPIQSGLAGVCGVVFVPGTRSILFFGPTAQNYVTYGPPGPESPWVFNGEMAIQVWAYDANDFVKVKNGTIQSYQCLPYDVWNFTLPYITEDNGNLSGQFSFGGAEYDPVTGRIYIVIQGIETVGSTGFLPVVYALNVTVPSSEEMDLGPEIGTLAAAPTQIISGQISSWANGSGYVPAGSGATLWAGNVYARSDGSSISGVQFFKNSGSLGYGSFSSGIPNNQMYNLNVSTSGWGSGVYTMTAQALDTNGALSNVVTCNLTIN